MNKNYQIIGAVGITAIVAGVGAYLLPRPASEQNLPTPQNDRGQVQVAAEKIIASQLVSPASAQFSSVVIGDPVEGTQNYYAFGDVDSQNSFGALLRTHFFSELAYQGGDKTDPGNWKVWQLVLGDSMYIDNGAVVTSTFTGNPEPRSMGAQLLAEQAKLESVIKLINMKDDGIITQEELQQKLKQL